jgi:hypothetical protein
VHLLDGGPDLVIMDGHDWHGNTARRCSASRLGAGHRRTRRTTSCPPTAGSGAQDYGHLCRQPRKPADGLQRAGLLGAVNWVSGKRPLPRHPDQRISAHRPSSRPDVGKLCMENYAGELAVCATPPRARTSRCAPALIGYGWCEQPGLLTPAGSTNHRAPSAAARRRITHMVDMCAFGRLATRVCAMTFAVVARSICQTLLARMSAGH